MAKRKRLTLPGEGLPPVPADPGAPPEAGALANGLEAASMFADFGGAAPSEPSLAPPARPPIAAVTSEAALSAALAEVTQTLQQARREGRLVQVLPLAAVRTDHLVRDRLAVEDEAMAALRASLRDRGQQTPIDVVALPDGGYGLISGFRRVAALQALAVEQGAPGTVLAVLRHPAEASDAYLAMVEENEIRAGLSHYERARIAVKAVEQGVYPGQKAALLDLFRNVSRAKRSKIGSFMLLVTHLDSVLRFPGQIGERLGLRLSQALERPGFAGVLREALQSAGPMAGPMAGPDTPQAEQAVIGAVLRGGRAAPVAADPENVPGQGGPGQIAPGLCLHPHPGGGLVLSGPGVDAGFRLRLEAWLRAHG